MAAALAAVSLGGLDNFGICVWKTSAGRRERRTMRVADYGIEAVPGHRNLGGIFGTPVDGFSVTVTQIP
jgi:hypothetical protein